MLVYHFIKNRRDIFLGKCWIREADNGFKVVSGEYGFLFFDEAEFLVLDVNLPTRLGAIARAQPQVILHKMTFKAAGAEFDLSFLISKFSSLRRQVIIAALLC